jgi:hypothetical protein
MLINPVKLGTKNRCAGEDQQKVGSKAAKNGCAPEDRLQITALSAHPIHL